MAKGFDPEALVDAKKESQRESKKFKQQDLSGAAADAVESLKDTEKTSSEGAKADTGNTSAGYGSPNQSSSTNGFTIPEQPPIRDEFRERYEEYFKSMGGAIGGSMVVHWVDDLKTNFFYLYAKKNGIDVPKEALKMDEKSRAFASFLIDEAIGNNLFEWIKKYPMFGAIAVLGISSGSTFVMLEMMKKSSDEARKKDAELKSQSDLIEKLKREKQEMERRNAQTVEDLTERIKGSAKAGKK